MKSIDFRNNITNQFCQLYLNKLDIFVNFYQSINLVNNKLENKSFYESYQYKVYNHSTHPNRILLGNRLEIKEELPIHYKRLLLIQSETHYSASNNCYLLRISCQELHIRCRYQDKLFAECCNKGQKHSILTSHDL